MMLADAELEGHGCPSGEGGQVQRIGVAAVGRPAAPDAAHVLAASAAFTRSDVSGYWRSRTPVASKNALATAAAVAPITSSPAPVEGSSRRCTTTGVTCGCSAKRSTGYDTQSRLVTPFLSNVTSSLSVRLTAWIICPTIWFSTSAGLITCPASSAP